MNARTLFIGCLTGLLLPLSTFGQGAEEARELLMQMTLREKAEMVIGHLSAMQKVNPMNPDALRELDFTYPGLGMPIGGCPRLGLPVTICSDGSYGLKRYMPMADGKYYTTVSSSPSAMPLLGIPICYSNYQPPTPARDARLVYRCCWDRV